MTIAVIGAGASGMMAALTAAEQPENKILLFERQARVGRKLAVTGNGRCNLTNTSAAPENYHGAQPDFAAPALAAFPPEAALRWFAAHGLMTVTEPGGRVYPLSNAANSVVDVLRFALARPNIALRAGEAVTAVRRQGRGFAIETESETIPADRVIIACGGAAGAKAGGVRDGYTLLQSLGHRRTALHPALVQLTTDPTYPRALKGVRADARVTLTRGRAILARSAGEVQFTEKGVSGPAIFEISRAASCGGEGQTVTLDLLRAHSAPDCLAFLQARRVAAPTLPCEEVLTGTVHNRVGKMLLRYAAVPGGRPLGDVTDQELKALVRAAKGFALPVRGTEGFESAQVTAGGIRTDEFDPATMGSLLVPGLYACGEVLDIDGDCGGYNLQWAWASGRAAGEGVPMIAISNLKLAPGADEAQLLPLAAGALKVQPQDITGLRIRKKSLDARKKDDIHYVYTVGVTVRGDERKLVRRCRTAAIVQDKTYPIPRIAPPQMRPVIVGFGPAGMFAALLLARAGARPIVLERGPDAQTRSAQIAAFRAGGPFDPECNVQFGEGGAGTFSDGKLNTGTHDARIGFVLAEFAAHGAPEHITYDAKPHIGTDVLVEVVQNLRREVIDRGGEVRFGHRVTGLSTEDGHIAALTVAGPAGSYTLPARQVILAIGHSARDTFEMLHAQGVPMEPKPFSMGVRIEHRQADINAAQYGAAAERLPAADYSLSCHLPDGSSAYTFCMCPGGEVFAAASEAGGVCTNGMSNSRRDGENANAAVLVTLRPEDFPDKSTLGGMYWQRSIEQRAFARGGGNYHAPAQLAGDFLAGRASTGPGRVQPTYRPGVTWCDLHDMLPACITDTLAQALPAFGRKLRGFDDPDAVLTAPETRSSSPVRIVRGEDRCSTGVPGLYPCGEGAGYAGGITSAAVDGLRCAESVLAALQNEA